MKRSAQLTITSIAILVFVAAALGQIGPNPAADFTQTDTKPAPPVTRKVAGRVLTSKDIPAVQIEFDKAFKYAGAQSFVLYNVANAEQHFFVDADKDGRIRRFYWIQFEGYLPDNTHTYTYNSPKIVNSGGFVSGRPQILRGPLQAAFAVMLATAATHPQLWAASLWSFPRFGYWPTMAVTEGAVVVVEAAIVAWVAALSPRRALAVSALANATSFAVGLALG